MRKLLIMLLALAMAVSLLACGSEKTPEREEPAANPEYTVTVLDETGAPVPGAMVQLCKEICAPGVTDEDGIARFQLPRDAYKVTFLVLPEGYAYADDVQEFYFEDGTLELQITLTRAV